MSKLLSCTIRISYISILVVLISLISSQISCERPVKKKSVNLYVNDAICEPSADYHVCELEYYDPPISEGYEYRIELVERVYLRTTCYSGHDDNADKGRDEYSNKKYRGYIPRTEWHIEPWHYGVAINFEMKGYHESMIKTPDGLTHKYRFHVPYYNTRDRIPSDHYDGYLKEFNSSYYSVPRDRMPAKRRYGNRIDVLLTGSEYACDIKASRWMRNVPPVLPIEIYEICKYKVYSDGTEERIE